MPPSGNLSPPSGRIICGTGRHSHSKPTTTNSNLYLLPGTANRDRIIAVTESETEPCRLLDKSVISKPAWNAVKQASRL